MPADKQHAHQLLDRLGPDQLAAVLQLLEVMVEPDDDEPLTEEDRQAVSASREYFRQNPAGGIPFEQVVAELGFTMDQVRDYKGDWKTGCTDAQPRRSNRRRRRHRRPVDRK